MKRVGLTAAALLGVAAAALLWSGGVGSPPTLAQVRAQYRPSDARLLDRHGQPLQTLRIDPSVRRLPWTPLADIAPIAARLLQQAEDQRFYHHHGIDWLALGGAIMALASGRERGGSTLSMQVAAKLDPSLAPRGAQRNLGQKFRQLLAARRLERHWRKSEILEAYLNLAQFRGELQGINSAAQGLFGKAASGLNQNETLLLAALLRSPNASPAATAQRACRLARRLLSDADCAAWEGLAAASLTGGYHRLSAQENAPHVARLLLRPATPEVTSTLDAGLQHTANEALQRQLSHLTEHHVQDGAVLAVDNRTGEVLAYVGNSGDSASAPFVDGVQAPRQAGSTLKPFLYQLALEKKLLTAASPLDDSPLELPTDAGVYQPRNYDHGYRGAVSLRTSLASSLNIPAVRALMLTGTDAFSERLQQLGFSQIREDGTFYGYALALGSAEVTLWQLTNAYRALANNGRLSPLTLLPSQNATGSEIMQPGAAFIISDILADRSARSQTFGLDSPLATPYFAAVKTGTSKDMRDNWCVGYSARYTVGVWVGNFDGAPMWEVSGIAGAAPVWLEVMNALEGSAPAPTPTPPASVVRQAIRYQPAIEPPRDEWFLSGTESPRITLPASSLAPPRIVYPAAGTVLALDPDIPPQHQRVLFRIAPTLPGLALSLDGRPVGNAWAPRSGRHRLILRDVDGKAVDQVDFTVRGALASAANSAQSMRE